MEYLSVRNFEKYQHYKDRRPPWIKLYWSLISDPNFYELSDASKWVLIAIMLLASQHDNKIPFKKSWIIHETRCQSRVNWEEILNCGFIICQQDASNALADCKQPAIVYKEYKEETETDPHTPKGGNGAEADQQKLFEAFYTAYPRHENPEVARKAFRKAGITANDLPQILDWIEKAKQSLQWQEKDKIPYPATFLNQRRWTGDTPPASTGNLFKPDPPKPLQVEHVTLPDGRLITRIKEAS